MEQYRHPFFTCKLGGDLEKAELYVKHGEAILEMLLGQLRFQGLQQGYLHRIPEIGVDIYCSVVGNVRTIEIFVEPVEEKELKEEWIRPCFCNCCFAECKIVRVDGTLRTMDHIDVPLPYHEYEHGDRRLRYDVDVCSHAPTLESNGFYVYEFYRVENVMPSDFTPYEVGDWAMIYFTDSIRVDKCEECLDCVPPEFDAEGEITACNPRNTVGWSLNLPDCIIVPIALDKKSSHISVMRRTTVEFKKGVCVKVMYVDWINYSGAQWELNCKVGRANTRPDTWTVGAPASPENNNDIHYCTQDGTTRDGSHAFRWGEQVYVLYEPRGNTIFAHAQAELDTYTWNYNPYKIIFPAILALVLQSNDSTMNTRLAWVFDYTHDSIMEFKKYSWADDDLTYPTTGTSAGDYCNLYLGTRRSGASYGTTNYGDGHYTSYSGSFSYQCIYEPSTYHTGSMINHGGVGDAIDTYIVYWLCTGWSGGWSDNVQDLSGSGVWTYLSGSDATWDVSYTGDASLRIKHSSYDCVLAWISKLDGAFTWEAEYRMYEWDNGTAISMTAYPNANLYWHGLFTHFALAETIDYNITTYVYQGTDIYGTVTWKYSDIFADRTSQYTTIDTGEVDISSVVPGTNSYMRAFIGQMGYGITWSSSLVIKFLDLKYDTVSGRQVSSTGAYIIPQGFNSLYIGKTDTYGVDWQRDAKTNYAKCEFGHATSRGADPFDSTGTSFFLDNTRPNIKLLLQNAIKAVPLKNDATRDGYVDRTSTYTTTPAYTTTFDSERQMLINLI